ncbi:ROK family transcriptional regulator [Phyllobacterium leguminum]|uniref:Putative NBD/HSP70 family sugar kinase n=1 Tax=Phyllobacterium leguminum TaxID=314237 RepID=A0A318SWQ4_9HYPH|nr:ROK family transcriptional regulator [Phyllobacterium leguminum]PYE86340.1 putative NBD/HSP70 family sugar kinase [Phyllobacterium leguminum]
MAGAITRPDDVRRQNRKLVLAAIRRKGALSRTDITMATGLSASTVSAIVAGLVSEGVLLESRDGDGGPIRRGRPQVTLMPNPDIARVGVVNLSLNRITVALVDYAGGIVADETADVPTRSASGGDLMAEIGAMLRRQLQSTAGNSGRLMHIAMAVQGVTDAAGETLLWAPIMEERNIGFGPALARAFGVPVAMANDCAMLAEALRWTAPERYGGDFAAILLSYGIGMGLYLKGQPFSGSRSSAAEFGHMAHMPHGALCRCGRRGCIEAYAGDYAIWRNALGMPDTAPPISSIDAAVFARLAERARTEPGVEREAFHIAGRAIGFGLNNLFSLIDPVPIALVGPGAKVFDLMEPEIRNALSGAFGWGSNHQPEIRCYPQEHPLILQGCAMTSLLALDAEMFSAGEGRSSAQISAA